MGKKKDKNKPKKQKDKTKVDARLKEISNIEPPDVNEFKKENEQNIDRFLRFGFRKKGKRFKSIKEKRRHIHDRGK